jgi:hypothetical protein
MARRTLTPEQEAARRQRKREATRLRMQRHRAKAKSAVTDLLSTALERVATGLPAPADAPQSLARRTAAATATAILKRTLQRHAVTVNRVVRVVSESLEAVKVKPLKGKTVSLTDHASRLRGAEQAVRFLQLVGEVPAERDTLPQSMHVRVIFHHPGGPDDIRVLDAPGSEDKAERETETGASE